MLRAYEKIMQHPTLKLPHFSKEKVLLKSINQFVPERLDWRVKFPDPLPLQKADDCYAVNVHKNLEDYGKLIDKKLVLPYEDLLYKDFANTPGGGFLEVALQRAMRQGVYTPRSEDDDFSSFGKRVPLSGYFKLPPMNEELFIRALAQQPLLASIYAGEKFEKYKGGIFGGETHDFLKVMDSSDESESDDEVPQYLNHALTAVAYTEDTIVLRNSWGGCWGKDTEITIERGHLRGVNEVYSSCFMPFMYNHMTHFNKMLVKMKLGFDHSNLSEYGPRDLKSMFYDKTFPIELKAYYMDDVVKFWNDVKDR